MTSMSPAFALLAKPAALLVLALACGGSFLYWSAERAGGARQIYERESKARDQAHDRLARVGEERRIIERYGPAYQHLVERGVIGAEQRVNWLDALRRASQATHGFGVDYQLSGQEGSQEPGLRVDSRVLNAQQSTMKLHMRLLHEGDLLAFLDALDKTSVGLHLLRECSVDRVGAGPFVVRFEPKLQAECTLTWVTLNEGSERNGP
jgi:hypothetical protein